MLNWMLQRMLNWVLQRLLQRLLGWMSLTELISRPDFFRTARSQDRAVLLWALAILTLGGLALIERNAVAALIAGVLLPLLPARVSTTRRTLLLIASASIFFFGTTMLLIVVPLGLYVSSARGAAPIAILGLASEKLLIHHFQSAPDIVGQSIHLGSLIYVTVPILFALLILNRELGWRSITTLFGATLVTVLALDVAGARWVNFSTLTLPAFRTLFVLLPVSAASSAININYSPISNYRGSIWLAAGFAVGAVGALLLPTTPIRSIAFDESHGHWETVKGSFGPNDFGRSANYTYTALYSYASKLVGRAYALENEGGKLPEAGIFVLKMPSMSLSEAFSERLETWVRDGGRLLIIADHTDLYDSSQNLNAFLYPRFGIRIGTNAVFDARGMPTIPITDKIASAIGYVNANGGPWAWQTGASLNALPIAAVELANFGMSFSEPGDYSRPNRFGPFLPRTSLRFGTHTSVMGLGVGSGAIFVVLDSTPWSNFSIFLREYKHLFSSILDAMTKPVALKVWGWSAAFLGAMFIACALSRSSILLAVGGISIGVSIGCAATIGAASFVPQIDGRDFQLRVATGDSAKLEFLKQLVAPGQRNFVRILSAMGKYGLEPASSPSGSETPALDNAKNWLLIQPDPSQLPKPEGVLSHISKGGNLSVIFGPEQAGDTAVRAWLSELGLITQRSIALSVAEDARTGGLLNRRGSALLRDVRTLTVPAQTAKLKERDGDQLIQSYTVRPTTLPRTSGLLNVGFSSDQFTDDAIGEIWEGIYPSAIGKLREQQLAATLLGSEPPPPMPTDLKRPPRDADGSHLHQYLLLVDGKSALSGSFQHKEFEAAENVEAAPIDNPISYLESLRDRSTSFIASSCPRTAKVTQCAERILSPDMLEWMVSWASSDDGKLIAIELLHERRFSGVGSTLNVIFTN
ncbi:DUF4350 domain-containing protein [Bradyrhizobium ottawaense]|uniref:DUF4350 domain-containing protein n=1 Tax=Bradyrhizobium ottawaense TaxID=931866 RepID=UPI0030C756C7